MTQETYYEFAVSPVRNVTDAEIGIQKNAV